MALGDYEGVREMLQPRGIWSESPPSLKQGVSSTLKAFLIDTLLLNPALNKRLATEVLGDMGIAEPQDAVIPMVSLAEHGGMVLSMRDYLMSPRRNRGLIPEKSAHASECLFDSTKGTQVQGEEGSIKGTAHQGYFTGSHTICRYLLDRRSLKHNLIKVVATGEEALSRASELGAMLVEAFGYPMPQGNQLICGVFQCVDKFIPANIFFPHQSSYAGDRRF